MLTEKTVEAILSLQKIYPEKRSALIPALHLAQHEVGYLPRSVQEEVADLFSIEPNEIHSIVTFYDMFFDKPVGKHLIHVCKNVSCMLLGADAVLGALCKKLDVAAGETTKDGEFTIVSSECLAACDRAPMMLVDDKVVGPIKEADLDAVIEKAKLSAGHPSPVTVEKTHA